MIISDLADEVTSPPTSSLGIMLNLDDLRVLHIISVNSSKAA